MMMLKRLEILICANEDLNIISNIAINDQKCLAWSGDFDPLEVE